MSDMTTTQAVQARRQLEVDIQALLHQFSQDTGLVPLSVELDRATYVRLDDRRRVVIGVTVRVEL